MRETKIFFRLHFENKLYEIKKDESKVGKQ